jgi:hypothetical protein
MEMTRFLECYNRGKNDAVRNRAAIFRQVSDRYEPQMDDPLVDEWSQEDRRAYVAGYAAGEQQ